MPSRTTAHLIQHECLRWLRWMLWLIKGPNFPPCQWSLTLSYFSSSQTNYFNHSTLHIHRQNADLQNQNSSARHFIFIVNLLKWRCLKWKLYHKNQNAKLTPTQFLQFHHQELPAGLNILFAENKMIMVWEIIQIYLLIYPLWHWFSQVCLNFDCLIK